MGGGRLEPDSWKVLVSSVANELFVGRGLRLIQELSCSHWYP